MMESDSLWTVAFCVMAFFSVITNVMVLWTVFGHRRMQTNTNIFLVNIAIVDLLMAVLNAVPNFFHMRDRYIHIYFHKPLFLPFIGTEVIPKLVANSSNITAQNKQDYHFHSKGNPRGIAYFSSICKSFIEGIWTAFDAVYSSKATNMVPE